MPEEKVMGPAGHYHTVYFVSLLAGFREDVAFRNAFFSEMPDEVDVLDAAWVQERCVKTPLLRRLPELPDSISFDKWQYRDLIHRGLHCLTGGSAAQERQKRTEILERLLRSPGPGTMPFGLALHAFGDSYFHAMMKEPSRMYETGPGHAVVAMTPVVTSADFTGPVRQARAGLKREMTANDIKTVAKAPISHRERLGHSADFIHLRQKEFLDYVLRLFDLFESYLRRTGARSSAADSSPHRASHMEISGLTDRAVAEKFARRVYTHQTDGAVAKAIKDVAAIWLKPKLESYQPEKGVMGWEQFQTRYQSVSPLKGVLEKVRLDDIVDCAKKWAAYVPLVMPGRPVGARR